MQDAFGVEVGYIAKFSTGDAKRAVKKHPEATAAAVAGTGLVAAHYGSMGRAVRVASKMTDADYKATSAGLRGMKSAAEMREPFSPSHPGNPFRTAQEAQKYKAQTLHEQGKIVRHTKKTVPGAKKVYPTAERWASSMRGAKNIKTADPSVPNKKWEYVVRPGKVRAKADRKIMDGLINNSDTNPATLHRATFGHPQSGRRTPSSWTTQKHMAEQHASMVGMAQMANKMSGPLGRVNSRLQGIDHIPDAEPIFHTARKGSTKAVNISGLSRKTSQGEWVSHRQGSKG